MRLYADSHGDSNAAAFGVSAVEAVVTEMAESVLLLTAVNIALRDRSIPPFEPTWHLDRTMTKQAMETELNNCLYVEKLNPADKAVFETERSTIAAALRTFGGSHPEGSREYIRGVLRVGD